MVADVIFKIRIDYFDKNLMCRDYLRTHKLWIMEDTIHLIYVIIGITTTFEALNSYAWAKSWLLI